MTNDREIELLRDGIKIRGGTRERYEKYYWEVFSSRKGGTYYDQDQQKLAQFIAQRLRGQPKGRTV